MSEPRPLHRLFGLSWIDFFRDTDVTVESEVDLSHRQQFIDLVLIRTGSRPITRPLPDGFQNLTAHTLVTFKSHQEALDGWSLCELIGHYVNYRKQASPSMQDLLPETDFGMIAVSVRFPQNLASLGVLRPVAEGIYEVAYPGVVIRVVVVHQLPQQEQNAMLHLFSANVDLLRYGQEHYRPHSRRNQHLAAGSVEILRGGSNRG